MKLSQKLTALIYDLVYELEFTVEDFLEALRQRNANTVNSLSEVLEEKNFHFGLLPIRNHMGGIYIEVWVGCEAFQEICNDGYVVIDGCWRPACQTLEDLIQCLLKFEKQARTVQATMNDIVWRES